MLYIFPTKLNFFVFLRKKKCSNYPPPWDDVVELVLVLKMVLKIPAEMKQKTRGTRIVKPIHPGER